MFIPSWHVITWPVLPLTEGQWASSSERLRHFGTTMYFEDVEANEPRLRSGQILWGTEHEGQMLGVGWDWSEVRPGVVCLSNPMGVLSNFRVAEFENADAEVRRRAVLLNKAIYELPWQSLVVSKLAKDVVDRVGFEPRARSRSARRAEAVA